MRYIIKNNEAHIISMSREDSAFYTSKILRVPEYIEDNGNFYPVTQLRMVFAKNIEVEQLFLPKTIKIPFFRNKFVKEVHIMGDIDKLFGFGGCILLEKVHVHGSIKAFGGSAFEGCKNLKEIIIDNPGEIEIHCGAFANCSNLEKIHVGDKPIELKFAPNSCCPSAFSGCCKYNWSHPAYQNQCKLANGLLLSPDESILYTIVGKKNEDGLYVIPESVEDIYHGNCYDGIRILDFSKSQLRIIEGSSFQNCINLEELVQPKSGIEIGNRTFVGCTKLHKIKDFCNISKIGPYAFCNTGLKECVLSSSILEIPEAAFSRCKDLRTIEIPLSVKSIHPTAFNACNNIVEIKIPQGWRIPLPSILQKIENTKVKNYTRPYQRERRPKMTGAYTHGSMSCPYCKSSNVRTYCDGTAECNKCGGEYTYWSL